MKLRDGNRAEGPFVRTTFLRAPALLLGFLLAFLSPADGRAVVLAPGDLVVSDQTVLGLLQVDPVTGDRTVISSSTVGTGPSFSKPSGTAHEASGSIVVIDEGLFALIRVDPATGNRTTVSSSAVGTGPTFGKPRDIVVEASGSFVVSDDSVGVLGLIRVDPVTGDRTILSSATVGTGTNFSKPRYVARESGGSLLVMDTGLNAVLRVDPTTGDRTIVSSAAVGTGTAFNKPRGIAVESSGSIVVSDSGVLGIFRVDATTGDRTLFSSNTVGTGPAYSKPEFLDVEASGDIVVVDGGVGVLGVLRVNPVTGDRVVASSSAVGTGTNFGKPKDVAVTPATGGGGVCGDGTLDAGEACDDGNTVGGDCCSATCTFEASGSSCDDADACTTGETCDGAGACGGGAPVVCDDALFCNGVETCDSALGCQPGTPPATDDGVACTVDSCDEATDTIVHTPDNTFCDDALFCNGAEICDLLLDCQPGTPPATDDGVACTVDSCDEATDTIVHTPDNTFCDDALFCNGAEICDLLLDCQPGVPPATDDGVACTVDSCDEAADTIVHTPDNAVCDDALFCNGAETCDPVLDCQPGVDPSNDGVACTVDSCDELTDTVTNTPDDTFCDNGVFCDGAETCDPVLDCQSNPPPSLDDGISCTVDACDEVAGQITHTPDDTLCDDALFCNGAETCDALLDCQAGTPPATDDGVACTIDSCDEATDTILHTPDDTLCDDALFCNGAETCDSLLGCQAGTPPATDDGVACTADSCDEVTDTILHTPDDTLCDDALFCNGAETCDSLLGCQAGTPPSTDDGVACTADSCDEVTDAILHTPDDTLCDDGVFCNGAETCNAILDCVAGTPPPIDDGVACTIDSCDEASGQVLHTPDDTLCDNALFCDGAETCDLVLGCQVGSPPTTDDGVTCTVDSCDEATDTILHTPDDTVCDDALFCNGAETCDPLLDCQAGTPPNLDDGIVCTVDSCDEVTDAVVHTPDDTLCDDSLFCNGAETCDAALGCQPGTSPADDGVSCTVDTCDEVTDTVTHTPDDTLCDNGVFCDGTETCDSILDCQSSPPPAIDDGISCTVDTCDDVTGQILHTPDDTLCDNGLFCDGVETCDPLADCQAGVPPPTDDGVSCTIDGCDEATDTILHIQDDTLCDDALFCNGAETCDAVLDCQAGTPPPIDDGVGCTVDGCNEATDTILHTPDDTLCDDALFCNGAETCDVVLDCQAGAPPTIDDGVGCTLDSCDEANDQVLHVPDDTICDDTLFCNGAETCSLTLDCQAGTPPVVDDGVGCTVDSCDEVTDQVLNTPDDTLCDNGLFCDGVETCDVVLDCQAGTPPSTDDGILCTIDSCDELNDQIVHSPDDTLCDDALFCNGAETCDVALGCQAGTPPAVDDGVSCTVDLCDEILDLVTHTADDTVCDDALFCNGAETCDPLLDCQAGTPPATDDGVACTVDACDEASDTVTHTADDTLCDNGQFCDGAESCDALLDCQAGAAPTTDDGVACTVDGCDEVLDQVFHTPDDTLCDDALFCNGAETCDVALGCQIGTPPVVDDGVSCTVDVCDEILDAVTHTADDTLCDDALFCNGAETCDPLLDCQVGTPPAIDDGVACTLDACDEVLDTVTHAADDTLCDDLLFCNGVESCDPVLDCQAGTPPTLDDGVNCTVDACDEGLDTITHTVDDTLCDDALFCNGAETCDPVLDCQVGSPPVVDDGISCTVDSCDEIGDVVVHTPTDSLCDDTLFCNGAETCDALLDCQAGTAPPIDDGVVCTLDSCDEALDQIVHTPDDTICDDALFCNGAETCDALLGCQAGVPPVTDDGVACTLDSCDELLDQVVHTADDTLCDDTLFCNGAETCDPLFDCQAGTPPSTDDGVGCTIDSCDEATDTIVHTADDTVCDDLLFCNGVESCDPLFDCQAGTPPVLDDAVGCTIDSCDEVTDQVVHSPDDTACSDGLFCNGAEVCDALLDCQAGTPPVVDDGVACTVDVCDEATAQVLHTADDTVCDDALFCNGAEFCDVTLGCQPGTPPFLDDGIACTVDTCDEVADQVLNTPDDTLCDDALFCNGAETCDPVLDCQSGVPPTTDDGVSCTVDGCDETTDTITHTPSDALCDNGLFCDGAETCDPALDCQTNPPPNVDDGIACTVDTCDDVTGQVVHTPDDTLCDDGIICNGAETCDPALGCQTAPGPAADGTPCEGDFFCTVGDTCSAGVCVQGGTPTDCSGATTACTIGVCNETADTCDAVPVADGTSCEDGSLCTTADVCQTGTCVGGPPPNCNDGNSCTNDSCNPAIGCLNNPVTDGTVCSDDSVCTTGDSCTAGVCTGTPVACDDGLFCNGAETCDPVLGCQAGTPPVVDDGVACTIDGCDEATDTVQNVPDDTLCSDGLFCNGNEFCDPLLDCQAGTPPTIDDGVGCTIDSCDEVGDQVVHSPTASLCDDGLFCNGAEVCDPLLDCQAGTPPTIDDGVACTVDGCDEGLDQVVHTPDDNLCSDGLFCNGAEFCDLALGCQAGAPPAIDDGVSCTSDSCDEVSDQVLHTPDQTLCDDTLFCNGTEVCDAVLDCQAGAPPPLDDGVACTIDTCDEVADQILHTPDQTVCNDTLFCNGLETCDPLAGCQSGPAPTVDDGISCTIDSCDEVADQVVNTPTNSLCDDGLFCNGAEFCDPTQDCQSGTPPAIDDGISCTIDSCNEVSDLVVHTPTDSLCDDALFCNGVESCDPLLDCQAGAPPLVDDGILCTMDVCDEVADQVLHTPDNTVCDDALFCNGAESCDPLLDCQPGVPPVVDDGVSCTADSCDETTDQVLHTPIDALCDNGLFCDGTETCDPVLDCQSSPPPALDDGVACTVDACDDVTGQVTHTPNDALCDDGLFCDGLEFCDPILDCQAGTPPSIDDGVTCTVDACDEVLDQVTHSATDSLCNDGLFCNGAETCDPILDCQAGTAPTVDDGVVCTVDSCDEGSDQILHVPDNNICDDALFCNGAEVCDAVLDCQPGAPPALDDGVSCTIDACDEVLDQVTHSPDNTICDDTLFCNGTETCDPTLGCLSGPPPTIDDGVSCTVDSCDELADQVVHTPSAALCDDGLFCNGVESCDPILDCKAGTAPTVDDGITCTIDSCDEVADQVVHLTDDSLCDDGLFCNGAETCSGTLDCQPGTAPALDDGILCTADSCDEIADQVVHTPDDTVCDDALFCNGAEFCDPALDCQLGTAPVVDDGVSCTADSCNETLDIIVHIPDDALCDNGLACDGVETCDAVLDCQTNAPPAVDDGISCTIDSCDDVTGQVTHTPSDALCSDGLFCNGAEICDPVFDCQAGAPPVLDDGIACSLDSCDEIADSVVHTPVDSLCDDGLFCNGSETCNLTLGCQAGTAPTVDDGVICTVDSCDEATDQILNVPNPGSCDDGLFCNGTEICDPVLDCQPGTAPALDDGVACTTDGCDEVLDQVVHTANPSICDDTLFCNGVEVCDLVLDCQPGSAPVVDDGVACTIDSCDEIGGQIVHTPTDAICDDGLFCNGAEFCDLAFDCQAGTPPVVDDGVLCTIDSCDEIGDVIVHIADDSLCDDGLFCNGAESCDAVLDCQAGLAPTVDDGVLCTADGCDEVNDVVVHVPDSSICDDALFCNGTEFCDPTLDCQAGAAPQVDDGVACTTDSCDEIADQVVHVASDASCDDGLFCNGTEFCDPIVDCQSGSAPAVDDGVACTIDSCDEITDQVVHTPTNSICDDTLFCNGEEICDPILDCQAGTAPVLDDGISCTIDSCDEVGDRVVHTPTDSLCDDALFCNGVETCDPILDCQSGAAPAVDDGVLCTADSCDEVNDVVLHVPDNTVCDDTLFCNGAEFCDPTLDCQAGTPPVVDDGVSCTADSCDELNDVVVHSPDDTVCDNGQACDGLETCDPVLDCQSNTPPAIDDGISCTIDACDDLTGQVTHTPTDSLCTDGLFCNGAEVCDPVLDCQPGTPPVVDDGVACTVDSCDEVFDQVVHTATDSLCDNGLFCDGLETCDALLGCQAGAPPVVDDGVACTVDLCDDVADVVTHTPNNAACDDALFCNGSETCDAILDCQPGTPPLLTDGVACTVDTCDELTDTIVHTPDNTVCDDTLFCNGSEICDAVVGCLAGSAPSLDDLVTCTIDSCDEVNDVVVHTPTDVFCDDTLFCNGVETCDPILDCQAGTPPNADDGVVCTIDNCDEISDQLVHTPNDALCDDALFCNGVESCDPILDCQAGTPPALDDGVLCTSDSCDEVNDVVLHVPDDTVCDDTLFCNGVEFCDATLDCQAGAAPVVDDGVACTNDSCDEVNDVVVHTTDDALCDNGQACDGLETCDALLGCQSNAPPAVDDGISCTIDACDDLTGQVTHT
ncbi:MAG: hypothetical protein ACE5FG_08715, partial [Myxococcota bacterium]